MGLDWHPSGKPRPGFEREWERLFLGITRPQEPRGWLQRLRRRLRPPNPQRMNARLTEISVSSWETLGVKPEPDVRLHLPECAGVPFYSNGGMTDFRAAFMVHDCGEILGPDMLERCYHSCLARELAELATELHAHADRFASSQGFASRPFQFATEELDNPESQLHILQSAARWAEFWSSRGHGMEADW